MADISLTPVLDVNIGPDKEQINRIESKLSTVYWFVITLIVLYFIGIILKVIAYSRGESASE